MFAIIITFISAISISAIAAGYSIIGLATLFAGATLPIIAMGSALEIGKLVAASWLYNNWHNSLVPKTIKAYLTTAPTNNLIVTLYSNGSLVTSVNITAGDTFSTTSSISGTFSPGDILEVQINNSDPTAKGLKIINNGSN